MRAVISANPLTQFIQVFRDLTYGLTPGDVRLVRGSGHHRDGRSLGLGARRVYRARALDLSEEL